MSNGNRELFEDLGKSVIILGFIAILVGTFLSVVLRDFYPFTVINGSS